MITLPRDNMLGFDLHEAVQVLPVRMNRQKVKLLHIASRGRDFH